MGDIDTLKKFGNVEKLGELQVPRPKIITYTRAYFEAGKEREIKAQTFL